MKMSEKGVKITINIEKNRKKLLKIIIIKETRSFKPREKKNVLKLFSHHMILIVINWCRVDERE